MMNVNIKIATDETNYNGKLYLYSGTNLVREIDFSDEKMICLNAVIDERNEMFFSFEKKPGNSNFASLLVRQIGFCFDSIINCRSMTKPDFLATYFISRFYTTKYKAVVIPTEEHIDLIIKRGNERNIIHTVDQVNVDNVESVISCYLDDEKKINMYFFTFIISNLLSIFMLLVMLIPINRIAYFLDDFMEFNSSGGLYDDVLTPWFTLGWLFFVLINLGQFLCGCIEYIKSLKYKNGLIGYVDVLSGKNVEKILRKAAKERKKEKKEKELKEREEREKNWPLTK